MVLLMVMLSFGSRAPAAPAEGGVVFNEPFEAGNTSSIESGSVVHSTGRYCGRTATVNYNTPKVISLDGNNSLYDLCCKYKNRF